MPTFALALGLAAVLAGTDGPARPDAGLLIRVQAAQGTDTSTAAPVIPPAQAAMPFTQGALPGQAPTAPNVIYQGPPGQALSDPAIEARINAQIQALLAPPSGGFTVQRYARPDAAGAGGGGSTGSALPGSLARSGGSLGAAQQAGYPAPVGGSSFSGPHGAPSGPGGFGGQGGGQGGYAGQGGGSPGQGGHPGQNGGYPAQAGFQGQGGYPGQNGSQGHGGGYGGYGQGGAYGGPPPVARYAVARAGDTVYASLDQGYNSDDPQAPIFATIYDVDSSQQRGPLHGVRLIGQIVYSSNQAAIQFTQMVLNDGRQFPLKAYAISARDARTGVSNDVDEHTFERYAGLFAATLIQGAGQAGQLLLQTNRNVTIDPATGLALSSPGAGVRTQAALSALLPLGQAATAIGAQNFNKPATIAGAPGSGIGVVFLEPPALPRDAIYGGGGSVYRGPRAITRLN